MIRSPSVKRLVAIFDLTTQSARLIKLLCLARDSADALEALVSKSCPATAAYARSCHSSPYQSDMWRTTIALHAIDCILGTHGVESLGDCDNRNGYRPEYEYCNTGDAYSTTLIYRTASDNLFIGSWGNIAERMPESWGES